MERQKLQPVVLNLLTNAITFSEPGGRAELSCQRVGDEAHVSVSDTGRGIAADQLGRVFEPFVQVDARLTLARLEWCGSSPAGGAAESTVM